MSGKKGRSGRKAIKPDLSEVRKLSMLHPTDEELAAVFDCSVDTITRLKKDPAFLAAYEKGKSEGKLSLRRSQMKSALEGNTTMQIWMGKQLLGQSDKQDISADVRQQSTVVAVPETFGSVEEWEAFTQKKSS